MSFWNRFRSTALFALLPFVPGLASTFVPGGTLNTNTTWTLAGSPYIIQGDLTVSGPTNPRLTIDAGVEVRFVAGASLNISTDLFDNTDWRGQLTAVGTLAQPILFTADNGNSGGWSGIIFGNNADTGGALSYLQHCIVEKATRNISIHNSSEPSALANVESRLASDDGLRLKGMTATATLTNVNLHDNTDYALVLEGAPLPTATGLTRTGNGENRLAYTGDISGDLTFNLVTYAHPVVFVGETRILGNANPRLTIAAGSELRFKAGASLVVGFNAFDNNDWRGQLTAVGTAGQKITFTSDNGLSGGWVGILLGNNADTGGATSQMQHCIVEKGVRNLHLASTTQPATLADLELRLASDEGLRLEGYTTNPLLSNVNTHDNTDYGVLLVGCPLPTATGLTRTGNGENRLVYTGDITGDLSFNLPTYPHPVVFVGETRILGNANPRLTIAAGSELRFKAGASLVVGFNAFDNNDWRGQLTAVGTAGQKITFTADNGLSGGWTGILLGNNADTGGATTQIQHCIVEKGVRNLHLSSTAQPATLADLELRLASDEGLRLEGYTTNPVLTNLNLHDNTDYALLLVGCPLPSATALTRTANGENRLAYTGDIAGDLSFNLVTYPLPVVFVGQTRVVGTANPRLTLAAGSELRFKTGSSLQVSYNAWDNNDWRGQLTAVGTAGQPILFTADNGVSGGWDGILFGTNADTGGATSFMQHCIVEKAVSNIHMASSAQPAVLQDLELRQASDEGLRLEGYTTGPVLTNLNLHDNTDYALLLVGCPLPSATGLTRTANGENRLAYTGEISGDLSFNLVTYPHPVVFVGVTRIVGNSNPRLTIAAGSELRFKTGSSLQVSYNAWDNNDWRGQLTAVGTAGQPILFTADNGVSGGWDGILFGTNADTGGATSFMQHCIVEKAVRNVHLASSAQPSVLQDLELRQASDDGLRLEGLTTNPLLTNVNTHSNTDYGVLLVGCPLPVATNLTRTGNGENRLVYTGDITGNLTLDLAAYTHPVVFAGDTRIVGSTNPRLTITPGSELFFKPGSRLLVGHDAWESNDWRGQLTAVGTPEQSIRFSADSGVSGGWNGILLGTNADTGGATSEIQHCIIEKAVNNLVFNSCSSPDTLRYCLLGEASGNGLQLSTSYPLVANCDFVDNATAIHIDNTATTTIGDSPSLANSFLGLSDWYLYNNGPADVNARYNGWCTADGGTPADLIHDLLDNPAVGLVTYLPAASVDLLSLTLRYVPGTETLHLEWCPVAGATSYTLYSSLEPTWNGGTPILLSTTTDTWLDLPVSDFGPRHFFFATADITARGAGRSGGCR